MIYTTLHRFRISHVVGRNLLTERCFLFRACYKVVRQISFKRTVQRNGNKLIIPVSSGVGFMNLISNYESWMDTLLLKILSRQEGAVVDVGANIGQTMLKVLPVHKHLIYYAIEPNPYCAHYLEELVVLNGFENTRIVKCAISNTKGETKLLIRYRDDILATTSPSFRKYTKYSSSLKVPQTTGDSLFHSDDIDKIALIKIDVEGGELNVLRGFKDTINRHQPYLLLEILPLHSRDVGVSNFRKKNAKGIFSLLSELNYTLYNIRLNKKVGSITEVSTSLESCNYLAIPEGGVIDL